MQVLSGANFTKVEQGEKAGEQARDQGDIEGASRYFKASLDLDS
jgi:hypothetical protein